MRVPLELPPGQISDDTPFASQGAYLTGSNVRFWQGKPETVGSWETVFNDLLTGVCRNIRSWTNNTGSRIIAFGTHSKLQVYFAGTLSDITPTGLTAGSIDSTGVSPGYGTGTYGTGTYSTPDSVYYPRTWSLYPWGQNLVANPRGGTLYLWENDPETAATEVTNAPDQITCILVTPERQVLAGGCNEETSGTFNPLCIRGCNIGDLTDWTTNSNDNVFEHILSGAGRIVKMEMIGPFVGVWTDTGVHLGQFLGLPGQTYKFDRVATNCGLIGPNAVEVKGQTAFWTSPDLQLWMWTPGTEPQIILCPVRNDFADNVDTVQGAKIVAHSVSRFGEVWFHYPDARDSGSSDAAENSRYFALSTLSGTWFQGELSRTAFTDGGVEQYPLAADADGYVYYHEKPGSVTWSLTTAEQYLGEGERVLQIKGIRPDFKDQSGDVSLSIDFRLKPQSDAVTKGPFTLSEGLEKYDFRGSGAMARLTFSGTGSVRFGKPTFDAVIRGKR